MFHLTRSLPSMEQFRLTAPGGLLLSGNYTVMFTRGWQCLIFKCLIWSNVPLKHEVTPWVVPTEPSVCVESWRVKNSPKHLSYDLDKMPWKSARDGDDRETLVNSIYDRASTCLTESCSHAAVINTATIGHEHPVIRCTRPQKNHQTWMEIYSWRCDEKYIPTTKAILFLLPLNRSWISRRAALIDVNGRARVSPWHGVQRWRLLAAATETIKIIRDSWVLEDELKSPFPKCRNSICSESEIIADSCSSGHRVPPHTFIEHRMISVKFRPQKWVQNKKIATPFCHNNQNGHLHLN